MRFGYCALVLNVFLLMIPAISQADEAYLFMKMGCYPKIKSFDINVFYDWDNSGEARFIAYLEAKLENITTQMTVLEKQYNGDTDLFSTPVKSTQASVITHLKRLQNNPRKKPDTILLESWLSLDAQKIEARETLKRIREGIPYSMQDTIRELVAQYRHSAEDIYPIDYLSGQPISCDLGGGQEISVLPNINVLSSHHFVTVETNHVDLPGLNSEYDVDSTRGWSLNIAQISPGGLFRSTYCAKANTNFSIDQKKRFLSQFKKHSQVCSIAQGTQTTYTVDNVPVK